MPAEEIGNQETKVLQLIEEYPVVKKQRVKAGEVLIHKKVESENVTLPVDLAYEEVDIERIEVNQTYDQKHYPRQRQEGDVLIIPIVEEQAIIVKRYLVREELHITRRSEVRHQELSETIRRENLVVEAKGNIEPSEETRQRK